MRDFLRLKFSFGLASRAKSENMAVSAAILASLAVSAAGLSCLALLASSALPPSLNLLMVCFFAIWGLNPQYMCV